MEIVEMASAHLNNIQNALGDLQKQKANIEEEIQKLTQYYQECLEEVQKHSDTQAE